MGGVQMDLLAVGFLVFELKSSALLLGVVEAAFATSMLVFALFGGAVADRFERKRIIQISQGGASLAALFIAWTIVTGTVTWVHLLGAFMLQGVLSAFQMPARQAFIPQLVGANRLSNAIALDAVGMSVMTMVAPAAGGFLYVFIGPGGVYFVIAAMKLSAVVLTAFIGKVDSSAIKASKPMLGEIAAGLSYIWKRPPVLVLLLIGLATTLLASPFRVLMPVFVVDVYHRDADSMGLLVALMGLGSLLGALFIASLGKGQRGLILISGSFISGIALLLVATIPVYFAALGVIVIIGLGDAGRRALNQALIMEQVENEYRGRVMSVFMMNFGLIPLSVIPAGAVAEWQGVQISIGILAVILLVVSSIALVTQKQLRQSP